MHSNTPAKKAVRFMSDTCTLTCSLGTFLISLRFLITRKVFMGRHILHFANKRTHGQRWPFTFIISFPFQVIYNEYQSKQNSHFLENKKRYLHLEVTIWNTHSGYEIEEKYEWIILQNFFANLPLSDSINKDVDSYFLCNDSTDALFYKYCVFT